MKAGEVIAERFELQGVVGSGGMGTVWRARDASAGGYVALKVLRDAAPAHVERFVREASVLADLKHPGVAGYVAHGAASDGEPYLAMEWLEGEDLCARLARAGLTPNEAVEIVRGVAEVLDELQGRGIIHRDIKPSNIFLVDRDPARIKLLDFGVARLTQSAARGSTVTGMMVGTPGYMAPEQARGEREIDGRADLFSLGCVLFECLAGHAPFVAEHPIAVLAKILLDEAPRLSEVRPTVGRSLEDLVAAMLSKEAAGRLPTARALLDAIAALGPLEDSARSVVATERRALTSAERRLCTVVLAGRAETWVHLSSGVTAPAKAESHAPTQTAEGEGAIRPLESRLRDEVAPLGGQIQVVGDSAVVATFSASGAVTDQVSRAVRVALAFRRLLPELPVAVATGRGVVTENWPIGEVIDRAAALLGRMGAGVDRSGVLVDELTTGLLGPSFVVEGEGQARRLVGELPAGPHAARLLLGRATPFVGRDRDLDRLSGLVADALEEPEARAALVVAPPGVGKSRLRDELVVRLRQDVADLLIASARGDALQHGAPFFLIAQLLRSASQLKEGEQPGAAREHLRRWIEGLLPPADRERVSAFLAHVAVGADPESVNTQLRAAGLDPALMSDQVRRAWEDCLGALVQRSPLALVIDDLQWGDLPSVRLIDGVLRRLAKRPLVVLAFARPSVHDVFPKLWQERDVDEVLLRELPRRAALQLARSALGEGVPAADLERLIELSDGNVLHLEELIRSASQGRTTDLPPTVVAMLQVRLEALQLPLRRVLRAGAVFGAQFSREGVAHLLGEGQAAVEPHLQDLVEQEILEAGAAPDGAATAFTFRHALLREAASSMLTEDDAALGHRLAGAWLETQGERNALLLADHFALGGEKARASTYLLRAADDALAANDLDAALARAQRGLTMAPELEAQGELHRIQAEAYGWKSESEQAFSHGERAMRECVRDSVSWYRAVMVVGETATRLGRVDRLKAAAAELMAPGRAAAAPEPFATAGVRVAWGLFTTGQIALANEVLARVESVATPLTDLPRAHLALQVAGAIRTMLGGRLEEWMEFEGASAEAYLAIGDVRRACEARGSQGFALFMLGAFAAAVETISRARDEAITLGLGTIEAGANQNLGVSLARVGKLEEGLECLRRSKQSFEHSGDVRLDGGSSVYLARLLLENDRLDEAAEAVVEGMRKLEPFPPLRLSAQAAEVELLLRRGEIAPGRAAADAMMRVLEEVGTIEEGEAYVRCINAKSLLASGRRDEALAAATAALARVEELGKHIRNPELQRSFREAIPEHAELAKLVRELRPG